MRLKSELYKDEQNEICDKLIDILELDDDNSITLYQLDNDKNKQQKILDLIPDIRKYFSFGTICGASEPTKVQRPWMSIVRHISKVKYKMISVNYYQRIDKNSRKKTMRYYFS